MSEEKERSNVVMSEPLAYLITWTTHGTWLPGDERGWVQKYVPGVQAGDPARLGEAQQKMDKPPIVLDAEQRALVETTVRAHCDIRRWLLHALNARSNHVHVVVTAPETDPAKVMDQFKAWCSRRLNERAGHAQEHWWTRHGSTKWINDESYLQNAIRYVLEGQ
jgi:REP element-mobilizing transposase RayT